MKIEKAESKVRLSGTGPSAPADTGGFTVVGRSIQESGQVLSEIGDRMQKAQELQEHTEAYNIAQQRTADLIFRAKNDSNYKNSQKYIDELSKIRDDASKGLTMRQARFQFDRDFTTLSNSATMDIKQDARTKMVKKGIQDLKLALDQNEELYALEGNPARQQQIMKRMGSLIDSHASRGYISPDDAYTMKKTRLDRLGVKKFYTDLSAVNTVEGADQVIESVKSGYYDEQHGVQIDPQKKKAMIDAAESFRRKIEAEQTRAVKATQDKNEAKFAVAISRGELKNIASLEDALLKNEISLSYFEKAQAALTTTKKAAASERSVAFVDLTEKFNSLKLDEDGVAEGNTIDNLRKFREDVMDAYNAGKLQEADFQRFIEKTTTDYISAQNPKFSLSKAALELFRNASIAMFSGSAGMTAYMMREYNARAEQAPVEELPKIASDVVKKTQLKATPELIPVSENVTGTTDKNGIIRRTYQPVSENKALSIGEVYTSKSGKRGIVVGFDKDGTPLLDPIKEQNANKT